MAFGETEIRIAGVGPRPKMLDFFEFLWSCVPFDSDIDTRDPHSTEWKELTVANRVGDGRIDVDIAQENPLVLVVRGKDAALVLRAARYLAEHCGGHPVNQETS